MQFGNPISATTVTTILPPPVAASAPFQPYTDPNTGDVWIAQGGVFGGAWKRPTDTLKFRVSRAAAFSIAVGSPAGAMQYDTVQYDYYSLWSLSSFTWTVPLSGLWRITAQVAGLLTVANQSNQLEAQIMQGTAFVSGGATYPAYNQARTAAVVHDVQPISQGAVWNFGARCAVAMNGQTGSQVTFATVEYAGTGGMV